VSRSLPWPFARMHSNRFFAARLAKHIDPGETGAVMARHLKAAALLLERIPGLRLVYEAHEVFADTAPPCRRKDTERLELAVVGRAAALLANSNATAARLRALYEIGAPIEVVPNGVDYPESLPEKDWTRASERIVYAGSFFRLEGRGRSRRRGAHSSRPSHPTDRRRRSPYRAAARACRQRGCDARLRRAHSPRPRCGRARSGLHRGAPQPRRPRQRLHLAHQAVRIHGRGLRPGRERPSLSARGARQDDAVWTAPGDAASLASAIRVLAEDPERARRLGARVREKARSYTWAARGERLARVVRPLLERR